MSWEGKTPHEHSNIAKFSSVSSYLQENYEYFPLKLSEFQKCEENSLKGSNYNFPRKTDRGGNSGYFSYSSFVSSRNLRFGSCFLFHPLWYKFFHSHQFTCR